jgi:hypothetical protein
MSSIGGVEPSHDLIQTLRSTKTSRASADDENVDIATINVSKADDLLGKVNRGADVHVCGSHSRVYFDCAGGRVGCNLRNSRCRVGVGSPIEGSICFQRP